MPAEATESETTSYAERDPNSWQTKLHWAATRLNYYMGGYSADEFYGRINAAQDLLDAKEAKIDEAFWNAG